MSTHGNCKDSGKKKRENRENRKGKRIAAATVTINWNDIANEHTRTALKTIYSFEINPYNSKLSLYLVQKYLKLHRVKVREMQ